MRVDETIWSHKNNERRPTRILNWVILLDFYINNSSTIWLLNVDIAYWYCVMHVAYTTTLVIKLVLHCYLLVYLSCIVWAKLRSENISDLGKLVWVSQIWCIELTAAFIRKAGLLNSLPVVNWYRHFHILWMWGYVYLSTPVFF